jgi:opacity protein-like surface antigen
MVSHKKRLTRGRGGVVKKRKFLLMVGACALWSNAAIGADTNLPVKAPPRLASDPWTGWYVGGSFGAGAGNSRTSYGDTEVRTTNSSILATPFSPASSSTSTRTFIGAAELGSHITGSVVDLFAGYNTTLGRSFVVGGQLEGTVFSDVALKPTGIRRVVNNRFDTGTTGGVTTTVTSSSASTNTLELYDELRSMVSVVGRAGWLANPNTLLYVLGGGVAGHFVIPDNNDLIGSQRSRWVPGYTVGAGAEHRLTPHWSVRGEYRYVHFDVDRAAASASSTPAPPFVTTNSGIQNWSTALDFHLGKIGIVYTPWPNGAASSAYAAAYPSAQAAHAAVLPKLGSSDPWTGLYFGAAFGAGAGQGRTSGSDTTFGIASLIPPTTVVTSSNIGAAAMSGEVSGTIVDMFVGYNMRLGQSFVVGGQLEGTAFSDVTVKTIGSRAGTNNNAVNGVTTSAGASIMSRAYNDELRSMVTAVGRAGYLVDPSTLVYVLGGGVVGDFVAPSRGDDSFRQRNQWVLGYTVGIGGERHFTPNWSVRGEYRYVHFDVNRDQSTSSANFTTTSISNSVLNGSFSTPVDLHMGKIAVVYTPWATGIGGADAAVMPVKAVPKLGSTDGWTGFYVGTSFGAGGGDARTADALAQNQFDSASLGIFTSTTISSSTGAGNLAGRISGSVVDLFAGYNVRLGQSFVVGGQFEGTVSSDIAFKSSGQRTTAEAITLSFPSSSVSNSTVSTIDELRSMVSAVGRAGWLANPNTLLYVLGGGTAGHFVVPIGADPLGGARAIWRLGYTAGVGGEHRFTPNWSLRGEYRFVHFDVDRNQNEFSGSVTTGGNPSSDTFTRRASQSTAFDFHLGKVSIIYTPWATGMDAYAAAMPIKATAPADPWTGMYIGASFGAGAGNARATIAETSTFNSVGTGQSSLFTQASTDTNVANLTGRVTGSVVDLFAGYNVRLGQPFVVGVQLEGTALSDITVKTAGTQLSNSTSRTAITTAGVTTMTTSAGLATATVDLHEELRSMFTAVGRVGWLATPSMLLYALGGGALGHFVVLDPFDVVGLERNKWVLGYAVGVGGEHRYTPHWSIRGEYRYLHFNVNRDLATNEPSVSLANLGSTTTSISIARGSRSSAVDFHMGKIGIVYTP